MKRIIFLSWLLSLPAGGHPLAQSARDMRRFPGVALTQTEFQLLN